MDILALDSLNYILADHNGFLSELKVFKSCRIDTFAGVLEMAIIGSSHYLTLEGRICEIMSCHSPSLNQGNVLCLNKVTNQFSYRKEFSGLTYSFDAGIKLYAPSAFVSEEQKLLKDDFNLFHSFKDQSAITAIRISKNTTDRFSVLTLHTYPECNGIVETCSIFKKTN
jgi:hypothetical protein